MKQYSVTQILSPFNDFSMIDPEVLRTAAERGRIIHKAAAAYARGLFFFHPAMCEPYVQSFKFWFDRYVKKVILVETRFYDNEVYNFHGQIDLVVIMESGKICLVDLKSTYFEQATWKSQIAAYRYLVEKNVSIKIETGMTLCLSPKGMEPFAKPYLYPNQDFAAFLAALTAYRYFKT